MLDTIENLKGLEIYTPDGIFVGVVSEVILNIQKMCAEDLFVNDVNPVLAEKNVSIAIPMRWIMSIGDVIILNTFPEKRIYAELKA